MFKRYRRQQNNKGIALIAVLFVIFAVVILTTGFMYRSDMSLVCGQNLNYRTSADYMAWSGLEHARAVILSADPNSPVETWSLSDYEVEAGSNCSYSVKISSRTDVSGSPTTYKYQVSSTGYYKSSTDTKP